MQGKWIPSVGITEHDGNIVHIFSSEPQSSPVLMMLQAGDAPPRHTEQRQDRGAECFVNLNNQTYMHCQMACLGYSYMAESVDKDLPLIKVQSGSRG